MFLEVPKRERERKVRVCVLGSLYFGQKEGTKETWEEEDIRGDFPPCLRRLQHTHLVFLTFPHKGGLVCAERVQEVRSDVGRRLMVDQRLIQ